MKDRYRRLERLESKVPFPDSAEKEVTVEVDFIDVDRSVSETLVITIPPTQTT